MVQEESLGSAVFIQWQTLGTFTLLLLLAGIPQGFSSRRGRVGRRGSSKRVRMMITEGGRQVQSIPGTLTNHRTYCKEPGGMYGSKSTTRSSYQAESQWNQQSQADRRAVFSI